MNIKVVRTTAFCGLIQYYDPLVYARDQSAFTQIFPQYRYNHCLRYYNS